MMHGGLHFLYCAVCPPSLGQRSHACQPSCCGRPETHCRCHAMHHQKITDMSAKILRAFLRYAGWQPDTIVPRLAHLLLPGRGAIQLQLLLRRRLCPSELGLQHGCFSPQRHHIARRWASASQSRAAHWNVLLIDAPYPALVTIRSGVRMQDSRNTTSPRQVQVCKRIVGVAVQLSPRHIGRPSDALRSGLPFGSRSAAHMTHV